MPNKSMKHVSLCVLAYKRPEMLKQCLQSIWDTADYPYSLIVNLDGDDSGNAEWLFEQYKQKKVSYLILNGGNNRGVGRSFQNCLGVAEGDYIVKVDTDLTFSPGWLSQAIRCLDANHDLGAIGLFDYHTWDPHDARFTPENNIIEKRIDCVIVKDFVSCAYIFRSQDRQLIEPVDDDGNHTKFPTLGLLHVVHNTAFGVYKSTYVSGTEQAPYKTPTYDIPLLFGSGRSE